MKPTPILIAVLAGLASALLFAGLAMQSAATVGLALAAPIPVAIVGLGWGGASGYIAAIVGSLVVYSFTQSMPSALTLAAAMTLPTALAASLASTRFVAVGETGIAAHSDPAAPGSPPALWFPLPRILFVLTVATAAACVFLGWLLGYDPASIEPELIAQLTQNAEGLDPAEQLQLENLARLIVGVVPLVQPAVLTLTLVVCLYTGAYIARSSGRMTRPRDDIPAAANLPKGALLIFAVALAGTLLDDSAALVGLVFSGAFGTAFALIGLARLHRRTRGRQGRGMILFIVYAAIFILTFPILVFLVIGIVETWRTGERETTGGA